MGKDSKIEWTDHTFNPWWGCVKISTGCAQCYAETMSKRFGHWWGVDAERRFFNAKHWAEPHKWNRQAEKNGVRAKVFCGSMCDFLERHSNPQIDALLNGTRIKLGRLILSTPHLTWLMLTKRLENFLALASKFGWVDNPGGFVGNIDIPNNVWLGTSVENQATADKRIPELLKIPAKIRFLSVEPMLGPVSIWPWITNPTLAASMHQTQPMIDWAIVGGESGSNKRPFNPDWARSIRDQCKEAGVPFFMKQIDKVQPVPDDLMIREFPDG